MVMSFFLVQVSSRTWLAVYDKTAWTMMEVPEEVEPLTCQESLWPANLVGGPFGRRRYMGFLAKVRPVKHTHDGAVSPGHS